MKTQLQSLQIALHGTQLKYARNTGLFQAICRSGENYQLFLPATAMHLWFSSARGPRVVLIRMGGPISGRPALARSSCSDQLPPDSGRPLTALSSWPARRYSWGAFNRAASSTCRVVRQKYILKIKPVMRMERRESGSESESRTYVVNVQKPDMVYFF